MDHQSSYNKEVGWRKRQLSYADHEDGCTVVTIFMPFSKRSNNLHLNGSNLSSTSTQTFTRPEAPTYCECRLPNILRGLHIHQCSMNNSRLCGIPRQALPLPDLINPLPDLINIPNEIMNSRDKTPENNNHQCSIDDDETYSPDTSVNSNQQCKPNKQPFDLYIDEHVTEEIFFKPE